MSAVEQARTSLGAIAMTSIAMLAFAGNSLLCRLALGQDLIDAATFTTVRVLSGALLLFGAVQLTMFATALRAGERLSSLARFGVALAVLGLGYLVAPGVTAPEPAGALLMTAAGIAWGIYSLLGRGNADPLRATALNFIGAVPMVAAVSLLALRGFHGSRQGLLLAVASGALTSGLGYVVWYAALRHLSAAHAATVQLSVPVIAAIGGVALLAEPVTLRLALASVATLGGIAMVLASRRPDR